MQTRRIAIASLCAAVAVPVIARPALAADAELIALGKEMDRLYALMVDAQIRAKPNWDAWQKELAAFGLRGERNPILHISNEEYEAAWDRVDAAFPVAFPTPDDVSDMMDAPSRRIMALPAATVAGLAVKARLYQKECEELWGKPLRELDWQERLARQLAESVLRLASVQS